MARRRVTPKPASSFRPTVGDQFLRGFKFAIAERVAGREPIWTRDGRLYPQSAAERIAKRELEQLNAKIEEEVQ